MLKGKNLFITLILFAAVFAVVYKFIVIAGLFAALYLTIRLFR